MTNPSPSGISSTEASVHDRYAHAAKQLEPALCCPTNYAADLLSIIPDEILQRDYGCGDPTPYVNAGDSVLDLGSGGGKLCYILSQMVGKHGRVIGVDCNHEMLKLARRYQQEMSERLGYGNVDFRYGVIQDLRLDLELLGIQLQQNPVQNPLDWLSLRHLEDRLRSDQPMIPDDSVDCVVSNCVLNLVRQTDRRQLFDEVFRVLKRGGRAAISDIVADENVPTHLQNDPQLWSGCISGAFREDLLLKAFEDAGFHGITVAKRETEPWRTVEGIEFRSLTIVAYKGKQGPCLERNQAVVYRGPFRKVLDDDGHAFERGVRAAVCDKTYQLLRRAPYVEHFDAIEPRTQVPLDQAKPFEWQGTRIRSARESKGAQYNATTESPNTYAIGESCC